MPSIKYTDNILTFNQNDRFYFILTRGFLSKKPLDQLNPGYGQLKTLAFFNIFRVILCKQVIEECGMSALRTR